MNSPIKLAFLSGTPELNRELLLRMRALYPDLPLWVVSDFPPEDPALPWIRYRVSRGFFDNLRCCREAVRGRSIRLAAVMLVPNVPFRGMRAVALALSPRGFIAFNEHLQHFMLRPAQLPTILRHASWRAKNLARWLRRLDWPRLFHYSAATVAGWMRPRRNPPVAAPPPAPRAPGIAVVIPSRNGKELLQTHLPAIAAQNPAQIVIVDNGSDDGTAEWLAAAYPAIEIERSAEPLSFARAVNRGIARARHAHVCLLNNDMRIEPGFFAALLRPFEQVPDLFCSSAQIQFPPGQRREETGKTVFAQPTPEDFPVRCDLPHPGEDGTWVLYGSGGCSLYDAAKLAALGNVDEIYQPAYVEDLDLGYRAWQRGWPSVYAAGAVVEHRHRATTSRYYSDAELERILERNYLRFVARSVSDPALFRRLWKQALRRLFLRRGPLRLAARIALEGCPAPRRTEPEDSFLALTNGSVSVFPGRPAANRPRVVIASPYVPFPLSHGGAVRMYNLMRRAADGFDQVLVAFTESPTPPPPELTAIFAAIVLVHRPGTHDVPDTGRPEAVEEFASPAFRAALRQTVRQWRPAVAQLEFTQMAQYAADCAPARTILVEHDITFDLAAQMLHLSGTPDLRREHARWRRFETAAWRQVDRVAVMSERDRAMVEGAPAIALPNGVDPDRFRPGTDAPEPRRILFIGSFAHRPNVLAIEFFVNQALPRLRGARLHIIAGARHQSFPVAADLRLPEIDLEGFVADVRPAYRRAAVVVAPLIASAGTNIKVLEAMAMGKAVVGTPAGVNGLDLIPGEEFVLARDAEEMARAIEELFSDAARRASIERAARARVESSYNWDVVAQSQARLYRELGGDRTC
ncbi:MAG: glycosyltransferase [Acidobacteria bacterium]|nr:glycosyltransferase [Acidobacteriota bacterium]